MNCYTADRSLPSIMPGEILGGQTATSRLIRAGHRRIGLIEGEVWMDASRDRLKGYRQALANAEILYDPDLVRPGNWEPSAGYEQTHQLMNLKDPPTAIFCSNDLMALGCYEALKELGERIPEDVAVMVTMTARYPNSPGPRSPQFSCPILKWAPWLPNTSSTIPCRSKVGRRKSRWNVLWLKEIRWGPFCLPNGIGRMQCCFW